MNPENRWIKKAETIPWNEIEEQYASLFPSETGMPAKPLQTALGALLIQKQYGYSDRELVEQIRANPYYQYFIGLPGYRDEIPFVPSLLVEFRKRLTDEILTEINEMIAEYNSPQEPPLSGGGEPDRDDSETDNRGTLILDATCAPQQISYPHFAEYHHFFTKDLSITIIEPWQFKNMTYLHPIKSILQNRLFDKINYGTIDNMAYMPYNKTQRRPDDRV